MMLDHIKLTKDHATIITALANDLGLSENEVAGILIEMGVAILLAPRKSTIKDSVEFMTFKMNENELLAEFSRLLEKYWDKG